MITSHEAGIKLAERDLLGIHLVLLGSSRNHCMCVNASVQHPLILSQHNPHYLITTKYANSFHTAHCPSLPALSAFLTSMNVS